MAYKRMKKIANPKRRKGEQTLGHLYPTNGKSKVMRRREWRGVKDTLYDYTRWLYIMSILARFISKPRNVKGMLRYR